MSVTELVSHLETSPSKAKALLNSARVEQCTFASWKRYVNNDVVSYNSSEQIKIIINEWVSLTICHIHHSNGVPLWYVGIEFDRPMKHCGTQVFVERGNGKKWNEN